MFSASRVMSFTAGQLGMLGGVLGALFIAVLGMPPIVGFVLTLAACAPDRRRHRDSSPCGRCSRAWSSISTCCPRWRCALMIQQFTAIDWSTEPQPFPRLFGVERRWRLVDEKFWLPMLACAVTGRAGWSSSIAAR